MKKRKVILIQLTAPVQSANASTGIFIPLALGLLKAQAIKMELCPKYFDIEILSRKKCLNYGEERLINYILKQKPSLVAFSCYGWNVLRSQYIAKCIKEQLPETKILFGGPEVGPRSKELLEQNLAIDIVSKGEGEFSFVEILESLLEKRNLESIKGITYRKNSEIYQNDDREIIEDLDAIASPYLYNALELKDYDELVFETSRGCPFNCSYCYYGGGNRRIRNFSLERIKEELKIIKMQGGPKNCEFIDSNFNMPQRLEELYPILKEINVDHYYKFRVEVNPEFVDEHQIEIFKELNVKEIEVGIQSTNESELKAINRRFDERKVTRCIELLKNSGITVNFHLIMGLPNQTIDSFIESNKFLIDRGVGDKVNSFLLMVLPGTDLRERAEELGIVYSPTPPYIVKKTKDLSEKDIAKLVDLRSEYITNNQLMQKKMSEDNNGYIMEEKYYANFELLRYNGYINYDYQNVEHIIKEYKYQDNKDLLEQLDSKILSRIIIEQDFFNESTNIEAKISNDIISVFNQVFFRIPNKKNNIKDICKITEKMFKDNPFVCTDLIFEGDSVLNDDDVLQIYNTLSQILKPFKYVEMERTRKRVELISIIPFSQDGLRNREKLSKFIMPIFKVDLKNTCEVEGVINSLVENNINAVLFSVGNVLNWKIICEVLDKIYNFNRKNNYVFFDNIAVQQFYLKNYVYSEYLSSKFTKYPYGHHDGELTLIYGRSRIELIISDKYPFE